MKRFALFVSCLLLICCVKPVQEQPSATAVPTAMQAETPSPVPLPEPERFPLIDAIAPLPDTVESVDLNDRLLVYISDEICYLYLHGLSTRCLTMRRDAAVLSMTTNASVIAFSSLIRTAAFSNRSI